MLPIRIEKTAHPKPLPPDEARLGFGEIFTDHMALADWTREDGWHNARVIPFGPLPLHPASTCMRRARRSISARSFWARMKRWGFTRPTRRCFPSSAPLWAAITGRGSAPSAS